MSFDLTSAGLDYDVDAESIFDPESDPLQGFPSSGTFVDAQDGTNTVTQAADEDEEDDEEDDGEHGQTDEDSMEFHKRYEFKNS
jgi:hypothetical protein